MRQSSAIARRFPFAVVLGALSIACTQPAGSLGAASPTAAAKATAPAASPGPAVSPSPGSGTSVVSAPGQDFTLTLESNRTTGYGWQIRHPGDDKIVHFVKNDYVSPQTQAVGAGGQETWTFRAIAPGQTTIALEYARPWEKDVAPAKIATYTIMVR